MKKTNILVTGAGALLGQGILRSLIEEKDKYNIFSADPNPLSTGHFLSDTAVTIPFASAPDYIQNVVEVVKKHKIEYLLVGTDTELPIFSKNIPIFEETGCKVVVAPIDVIHIANDKYKTAKFLKENNFPYPVSALTSNMQEIEDLISLNKFPYIAKPVDGARSKGIKIINTKEELKSLTTYPNNLVVQEFIDDKEGEFTTGCIVLNSQCQSIVSLRRDLRDGNTWRAYRDKKTSKYDSLIREIAEKLNPEGPANFQYRIKNGEPIIFEINGRFSGTTPIRAFFGFNEVTALMDWLIEKKPINQPPLREGIVLRTFSDIFVKQNDIKKLSEKGEHAIKGELHSFKSFS